MTKLEELVREIHAEHVRGTDDTCWLDIDRVFEAAGLSKPERPVGDIPAMLRNCDRFVNQLCTVGRGNWPSYVDLEKRIKELEAALAPFNIDVPDSKENETFQVTCGGWHLKAVRAALGRR